LLHIISILNFWDLQTLKIKITKFINRILPHISDLSTKYKKQMNNLIPIVIISAVSLVVIILLFWKNNKDKKLLNPGAQDAVEEETGDHNRRKDKI
jgi:amino acid transporter